MFKFATILVASVLFVLFLGFIFYWPLIRSNVSFFRERAEKHWLKVAEKEWQEYLARYSVSQRVEICKQCEVAAGKIIRDVILPHFDQMRKTYGGAKLLQLNLNLWDNYKYRVYSNMDPILHSYRYPVSGLNYRGIWLTVFKLIKGFGLEGKCYYEKGDSSMDYYIQMKIL